MGFIKDNKAASIGLDAQKAWDIGRSVYTPVINFPMFTHGFSGGNDDIAMMVEAILAIGWRLDTWTAVTDKNGKPQIMPLFIRPGADIR